MAAVCQIQLVWLAHVECLFCTWSWNKHLTEYENCVRKYKNGE